MYKNTNWRDHIVDEDSGEVIQEGTDQSAANFNNMEKGIGDAHLALALFQLFTAQNNERLKVLEVPLIGPMSEAVVNWPDGFSKTNSIVLPIFRYLNQGENVVQYVNNPAGTQSTITFEDSKIKVNCELDTLETLVVQLLLYRYK